MANYSNFEADLAFGQAGEKLVFDIFTGNKKVEVKTDRKWKYTGNIYIEYMCFHRSTNTWERSGISTTNAEMLVYVLEGAPMCYPIEVVKYAIYTLELGKHATCDDRINPSKGYLLTLEELNKALREYSNGS